MVTVWVDESVVGAGVGAGVEAEVSAETTGATVVEVSTVVVVVEIVVDDVVLATLSVTVAVEIAGVEVAVVEEVLPIFPEPLVKIVVSWVDVAAVDEFKAAVAVTAAVSSVWQSPGTFTT